MKFLKEKPTRKEYIKLLDGLLHQVVKLRDKRCVRCDETEGLAVSHCYPKGKFTRLRWDLENVLLFCFSCHICWWHRNPIEAGAWYNANYPDRAKSLKLKSQLNYKSKVDYKLEELYLKQEIKKYDSH